MLLAKINDGLLSNKPYTNHNNTPTKNMDNIGKDKADTSLVFQVLCT